MVFFNSYKPSQSDNLMKHEGDVTRARTLFYSNKSNNLYFLLKNCFDWMNRFIFNGFIGLEVIVEPELAKILFGVVAFHL